MWTMRWRVTRLIGDRGYLVACLWPDGIAAMLVGAFWRWTSRHWLSAGMSRHVLYVGPIGIEWAYRPRWISREECGALQAEALARTIERTIHG